MRIQCEEEVGGWWEEQIEYGEVGMIAGGKYRNKSISLESLQFNASTGIARQDRSSSLK